MPGARVVEVGAEDAVVERVLDGEGLQRKVEKRGDETWVTGVLDWEAVSQPHHDHE